MATLAQTFTDGMSAGRVFERAFAAVRHNAASAIGLAFLVGAVPAIGFGLLIAGLWPRGLVLTFGSTALPGSIAVFLITSFASQIWGAFAQAALVTIVIAENENRKGSFGEGIESALRSFLPLVGLGALIGVGVVMGTTLLVVPALIVYLLWSVAPSALAQEREGIVMALNRSQELGEGARWRMFAVLTVPFLVSIALGLFIMWTKVLGVGSESSQFSIERVLVNTIVDTIVYLVWSVVQASLYVELREWKNGSSVDTLEQVFV